MSDTIPTPGPSIPADLVEDYAGDIERELEVVENSIGTLQVLVQSMRREAERAKGTL